MMLSDMAPRIVLRFFQLPRVTAFVRRSVQDTVTRSQAKQEVYQAGERRMQKRA